MKKVNLSICPNTNLVSHLTGTQVPLTGYSLHSQSNLEIAFHLLKTQNFWPANQLKINKNRNWSGYTCTCMNMLATKITQVCRWVTKLQCNVAKQTIPHLECIIPKYWRISASLMNCMARRNLSPGRKGMHCK